MTSQAFTRVEFIAVDWERLEGSAPLARALAAADLLEQAAALQGQLALLRGQAAAEMAAAGMTPTEIARLLRVSQSRVSQMLGGSGRPDGIQLGLLRQAVELAEGYQTGAKHESALLKALETLRRSGRRSEPQARGIAAALAAIGDDDIDTDSMSATERKVWRRARAHALAITSDGAARTSVTVDPASPGEPPAALIADETGRR